MRRIRWIVLGLALVGLTGAAENQAFYGIFAETVTQKNAGQPDMSAMLQGLDPKMLDMLPAEQRAMLLGAGPQRKLSMRLWSPTLAPAGATAVCAAPAGLKQGPRLDLELYRPRPAGGTTGSPGTTTAPPPGMPGKFTIKRYWGDSATVKPGQPEVTEITWEKMDPAQRADMAEMAKAGGDEYFYKDGWTTGYWPTAKQPGKIAADAKLEGTYALTSSYTGNISITVPPELNFLEPISFTKPDLAKIPDLKKSLGFQWKPIPTCLGLHAQITGMVGRDTIIIWSSSEVREDPGMMWDYLEMAQVRAMVEKTQMMPGDKLTVNVTAGIFDGCEMAMMQMVGYGPGVALPEGQPLPRVQTKTSFNGMLGGKMLAAMPAMPGGMPQE
ncbi:MAG: hypothetical protein IT204_11735 [Fimbriimonadaceae bacterium]|nr:hypothetical protein [Fimbriimonadaceae bacterium]